MPTYGYACEKCGHEFDEFQSITSKPLRKCPACGKMGLKRLIGAGAAIIFKGSGFYQTDYRSDSYKNAATKEKNGGKKPDTAGGKTKGKADGKAASTSTEAKPKTDSAEKKKSA
jgi:putative FmdB family regulatory protein